MTVPTKPRGQERSFEDVLSRLAPIDLTGLERDATLLTRLERKYLLPLPETLGVLDRLADRARVLEIDSRRLFRYASLYHDTPDLLCYHQTARPRRRRFKVRRRDYLDSDAAYLEVKTRGGRGTTVKHRIEVTDPQVARSDLTGAPAAFVHDVLAGAGIDPAPVPALRAALTTTYRRCTLVLPDGEGRLTIDLDLTWIDQTANGAGRGPVGLDGVVVVETKSGARPSSADRVLWSAGHRPVRLSKFGTGLAVLRPDLPRTRWHDSLTRRLGGLGVVAVVGLSLVLAGCSSGGEPDADGATSTRSSTPIVTASPAGTSTSPSGASSGGSAVEQVLSANKPAHRASTPDVTDTATITLTGAGARSESGAVRVDGSTVTITAGGAYRLTGTLTDGQVVVDVGADDVVVLVLDGAAITSTTTAALAVLDAGQVVVLLADGSSNTLTDGAGYTRADGGAGSGTGSGSADEEVNAALYSAADLTLTGPGALTVTGRSNDGITGKDGLVVAGGRITVTAVDDGIRGKDYLVLTGGEVTVTAGGDGLLSDAEDDPAAGYVHLAGGMATLTAGDDGVQAHTDAVLDGAALTVEAGGDGVHADAALVVGDGTVAVRRSREGLESALITIAGGTNTVVASDDGINVTDSDGPQGGGRGADERLRLVVTGGTTTIDSGGDGLDSNGFASMSGGTVVVSGPTARMNSAVDVNGTLDVSGGTLLAAGSSRMADAPETSSAQGWVSVTFPQALPAGTVVQFVEDGDDDAVVATYTLAKDAESVVFSSSAVRRGATYSVRTGGRPTSDTLAGLGAGGEVGSATEVARVVAGEHTGGRGGRG